MKWSTRARKFPQLLGKTPSGSRIPGGPYTVTQVLAGMVVVIVGNWSMGLWGRSGLVQNWVILLGVAYGMIRLVGLLPFDARSPLAVTGGIWSAVRAPRTGELAGRVVREPRPQRVRGGCVIALAHLSGVVPAAVAVVPVAAARVTPIRIRHRGQPAAVSSSAAQLEQTQRQPVPGQPVPGRPVLGRLVPVRELTGVQRALAQLRAPVSADARQPVGVRGA